MGHRFKLPVGWSKDGCSGVPDLIFVLCCDHHDFLYQEGGDKRQRLHADRTFYHCMIKRAWSNKSWVPFFGWFLLANVYYLGVRLFGGKYFNWKESNNG